MPEHPAHRRPLVAAAALLLSVALTSCGDDTEQPATSSPPSDAATTASTPSRPSPRASEPAAAGTTLALTVAGTEVTPLGKAVELATGERLTLQITADRPGELHVHASPEQYVEFDEGKSTHRLRFDKPGQVDVEEHESGALVARLLVS